MHLLLVNKAYAPHIGGIESLVQTFAEDFAGRDGCDVKVLVCAEKGQDPSIAAENGVQIYRCKTRLSLSSCPLSIDFLRQFRRLARWADVIEFHMPFPLGDIALMRTRYKGGVVCAYHSDIVRQKTMLRFYAPILRRILRRSDKIIVATKAHITSSPYLRPLAEKCTIIPYGIDTDAYETAKKMPILREKASDKSAVRFLFVGRLVYYKGVDILLEAFSHVRGAELFLVGTGAPETEKQYREYVGANGKTKRVHFLGTLDDESLRAAYADCDVFVLPSVANSEAFGLVQLEAMVCAKPVINTSLPTGVPLVSLDGETGLTVPPGDAMALYEAMQTLCERQDLREKYGAAGKKRVYEHFSQRGMCDEVYRVLEDCAHRHR